MKVRRELISFRKPLRDVRLVHPGQAVEESSRIRELEEAAFERGRRQGESALSEQLLQQRADLLDLQNGVLESLRQLFPHIAHDCEQALVKLALESAQKLVGNLPVSVEMVEAVVREALATLSDSTQFVIFLNASDLELLQRANAPVLLQEVGGERLRFQVSRDVERGGCVIQTRFGTVDGRRETKVNLLKEALQVV